MVPAALLQDMVVCFGTKQPGVHPVLFVTGLQTVPALFAEWNFRGTDIFITGNIAYRVS